MANSTTQIKISQIILGDKSVDALIPSDRFQVKAMKEVNIVLPARKRHGVTQVGHVCISGYGIWDKQLNGWVSLNRRSVDGDVVPTAYPRKSIAVLAIKGGLHTGFDVVIP